MESILISIKKLLGISAEYTHFDKDIIMHINSVLAILTQIGVGSPNGCMITDENASWDDFMGTDSRINMIKTYVYLRVRLLFDPPTSSAVADAMKKQADELEFRISVQVDPGEEVYWK